MAEAGKTGNKKTIDIVKNLEKQGMSVTKTWATMWQESLKYFFGDQLHNRKAYENWDWVVLNYIWPAAIQEISKLARRVPKIIAEPWDSSDEDAASAWQGVLQWLARNGLNDHGMQIEQIKANLDAKLFGYRVYKVYWEPRSFWSAEEKRWIGDVKGKLWHPAHFWANDQEDIQNGACGTIRYVELEYAKGRWPEHKKVLEEEAKDLNQMDDLMSDSAGVSNQRYYGGTYPGQGYSGVDHGTGSRLPNQILGIVEGLKDNHEGVLQFVEIHETYYRDNTMVSRSEEEDISPEELIATGRIYADGEQYMDAQTRLPIEAKDWPTRVIREWQEPKYPRGRRVLWCGDTIFNDEDQVYQYKKWPFVVAPHYMLPHMWQGVDAVQMYKSTQDMINVTATHLVNNMKMFGDPKIAIEENAIATPKGRDQKHYSIGKGAGRIIRLMRGGLKKFKIIDPVSPSASHSQLYQIFAQEFKNQVGLQDISQGKAANTTATEASYLVQSANDRILLQSVFEEMFLREIMSLAAEVCQINYDEGRFVRIVGENDYAGITQITQGNKDIKFDVHIEVGSTLPFDDERRVAKYEKAYAVLQQPVANPMTEEMLQVLEIPNRKKLLKKYEAYQVYAQYLQIFEQVQSGQMDPVSAMKQLQQIAQQAVAPYMQQQIQGAAVDSASKAREQEEKAAEKAKGQSGQTAQ